MQRRTTTNLQRFNEVVNGRSLLDGQLAESERNLKLVQRSASRLWSGWLWGGLARTLGSSVLDGTLFFGIKLPLMSTDESRSSLAKSALMSAMPPSL